MRPITAWTKLENQMCAIQISYNSHWFIYPRGKTAKLSSFWGKVMKLCLFGVNKLNSVALPRGGGA